MKTYLFVYPGGDVPRVLPAEATCAFLPPEPRAAAATFAAVLADPAIDVIACWDARLGAVPWEAIAQFRASRDDAWHPGARLTGRDEADVLGYVQPLSVYRPDPDPALAGGVNWKLDLRATFLRAAAVRQVGGLDGRYATLAGAARELGYRMIRRGAVCRQHPQLVAAASAESSAPPSLADRYRLVRRHFSGKWAAYVLVRNVMRGQSVAAEVRAWRASAANGSAAPATPVGTLMRDISATTLPTTPRVSVILPTFGRYRYVAEVLDDLRAQTIRPMQILIADGNAPADREPAVYERYRDLPIDLLWHEEQGICSGRNAALARATGDYVWFVDDDSRFAADNLEAHLRVLAAYGADVSVGPAYTRSRPELHGEQREIVCTHMDCGTTLVRRELLDTVGGFDMEFNLYLAGEDGELGIRFVRAGGLMVNNPLAKRFHYVAPVGGSRTSTASVHRFTRWSLVPRPVQSIYYTAKRYYEPHVAWDAMMQAAVLAGWRRREGVPATRAWRVKTLLGELAAAPVTALRLYRSVQAGRAMIARGPMIPSIAPAPRRSAK